MISLIGSQPGSEIGYPKFLTPFVFACQVNYGETVGDVLYDFSSMSIKWFPKMPEAFGFIFLAKPNKVFIYKEKQKPNWPFKAWVD